MTKNKYTTFSIVVVLCATTAVLTMTLARTSGAKHKMAASQDETARIWDIEFAKSATAPARADLLANISSPVIKNVSDLSPEELATTLNGTWVRRLTMYGIPIETDSYFYFDMKGTKGEAMLIDRANLGGDKLTQFPEGAQTMTFVNCSYSIVDRYIKISDDAPEIKQMDLGKVGLADAWKTLCTSGYFAKVPKLDPAWLKRLKAGLEPGAELELPAITGGFWQVDVSSEAGGNFVGGHKGASLAMVGEYRSSKQPMARANPGREKAVFYKQGGSLIAAKGWACSMGKGSVAPVFTWDRVVVQTQKHPQFIGESQTPKSGEYKSPKSMVGNLPFPADVKVIDEWKTPGIEPELSGIYPVENEKDVYYVAANKRPTYSATQTPKLAEQYRGKLLKVDREGHVLMAIPLVEEDYGDIAYGGGYMYLAVQEPAEILKINPRTWNIDAKFPLEGPAGGMAYDAGRGVLYAQLFVNQPHLAVVDAKTGATVKNLWSDEGALGLKMIDNQLLCIWCGQPYDPGTYAELRVIDPGNGRVTARMELTTKGTDSCMAPLDGYSGDGSKGFMSLVTMNGVTGETIVRRYNYVAKSISSPVAMLENR